MRIRCPRRQYKSPTERRKVVSWSLVIGAPVSLIASNYLPFSGSYHIFGLNGLLWSYFAELLKKCCVKQSFSSCFFFWWIFFFFFFSSEYSFVLLAAFIYPEVHWTWLWVTWSDPPLDGGLDQLMAWSPFCCTSFCDSKYLLVAGTFLLCPHPGTWLYLHIHKSLSYLRERRSNEGKRCKRLSTVVLMNTASGEKKHFSGWSHTIWSGESPE